MELPGQPLQVILMQHGRSAAVLMDVEMYEGLLDEAVDYIAAERPTSALRWLDERWPCCGK